MIKRLIIRSNNNTRGAPTAVEKFDRSTACQEFFFFDKNPSAMCCPESIRQKNVHTYPDQKSPPDRDDLRSTSGSRDQQSRPVPVTRRAGPQEKYFGSSSLASVRVGLKQINVSIQSV